MASAARLDFEGEAALVMGGRFIIAVFFSVARFSSAQKRGCVAVAPAGRYAAPGSRGRVLREREAANQLRGLKMYAIVPY